MVCCWWLAGVVAADQVVVAWTSHLFGRGRHGVVRLGRPQSSWRPLHPKAMTHTERALHRPPATGL